MAHESLLSFNQVAALTGNSLGKFDKFDMTCPLCSAARWTPAHRKAKVLRVWRSTPDFLTYHCVHCGESGWLRSGDATPIDQEQVKRLRKEAQKREAEAEAKRSGKANSRWRSRSKPIGGTIGEIYFREARSISCELPPTLRFLPAWQHYHPAVIAAYGLPDDVAAGRVLAVQLTYLTPDGLSKAKDTEGRSKISIGPSHGLPIVIPARNGDGRTLAVAEGLEKALKINEATGYEVWVSTGASKLPKLAAAIPSRFTSVTVFGDEGEDGEVYADELARAICDRCEVRVLFPRRIAA
jgi:hypothetical protein